MGDMMRKCVIRQTARCLSGAIAALLVAACAPVATGPGAAGPSTPVTEPGSAAAGLNEEALWPPTPPGRLLFALYVMGSDLEDDVRPRNGAADELESGQPNRRGQATADLKEIAVALGAMTPAERDRIDVLVAFGGARQAGWQGVKTLDGAGLMADAADGTFGNAPAATYLADEPGADMALGDTFLAFLKRTQARAAGADGQPASPRVMLSLWNHGGGYAGLGPDTNSGGQLSLVAMRGALETSRFRANVLGFDACLMASVEVAAAMRNHFNYMVASSEVVPGHGWDYRRWLPMVVQRPEASMAEVAAMVVDTYIDSPVHLADHAITMSVINVARAAAVTASMDALAAALEGRNRQVLDAAEHATDFGMQGLDATPQAMDLAGFADALGPVGAALAREVRSSVVYSRVDDVTDGTSGLTTFSVQNRPALEAGLFNRDTAVSPAWFSFLAGLYEGAKVDRTPPVFGPETAAFEAGRAGVRLDVTDESELAVVRILHATQVGADTGRLVLASREHVLHADDYHHTEHDGHDEHETDRYFLPAWDGRRLTLEDGRGGRVVVPVVVRLRSANVRLYAATGTHNGAPATLFVLRGADDATQSAWIVPDQPGPRAVLAARQVALEPGDVLTFTQPLVTPDLGLLGTQITPAVTFRALSDLRWTPAPMGELAVYGLAATDLNGNRAVTTPRRPVLPL